MSRWYKQSNVLAKSLGISADLPVYKDLQRFEKLMKEDGSWQKIKQIKKQKGRDVATKALYDQLDEYRMDPELYPPDVDTSNMNLVYYEGRSKTGGDWYGFGDSHDYYELSDGGSDGLDEYLFYDDNSRYNEKMTEHLHSVLEDYVWEKFTDIKIKLKDGIENIHERLKNNKQMSFEFYDLESQLMPIQKKYEKRLAKIEDIESKMEEDVKKLEWQDDYEELNEWLDKNFGEETAGNIIVDVSAHEETAKDEIREEHIDSLREQLDRDIEEQYHKITCGGHWCISPGGGHLDKFISQGDSFLILRRDGDPRVAIRYTEGGMVAEVQGVQNKISNIDARDVIDLLDVPMLEADDVLGGLMVAARTDDPKEMKDDLKEILAEMEDEELTAPMIRELEGSGSSLIEMIFHDDASLEDLIKGDESEWSQPLRSSLLKGLGDDKDYISVGRTNVYLHNITGWLSFGLGILKRHGYLPHIVEGLKIFFAGNEYELLDEFFDGLGMASDKGEIIYSVIPEIKLLMGDKGASYVDQYLKEQGLVQDSPEAQEDFLSKGLWGEGALHQGNFDRVKTLIFNRMDFNPVENRDIFLVNQLWEKAKELYPNLSYELARNFCTIILLKYRAIPKSPHRDDVSNAMQLLYFITHELTDAGLSPELISVLKSFPEVQGAMALAREKGAEASMLHYQNRWDKIGPVNLQGSPSAIEGLPQAPEVDINNGPVIPLNDVQRQAKRSGWYKG